MILNSANFVSLQFKKVPKEKRKKNILSGSGEIAKKKNAKGQMMKRELEVTRELKTIIIIINY